MKHTPFSFGAARSDVGDRCKPSEFVQQIEASDAQHNLNLQDGLGATIGISARTLLSALDQAGVGIVHRSASGEVLGVNDRYCDLVGRTREEMMNDSTQMHWHPDDHQYFIDLYAQGIVQAEPFELQVRCLRLDRTIRWCSAQVIFLKDGDDSASSSLTVMLDISAQKRAEADLEESETNHRNSVELSPQISWTASSDGLIEDVSRGWEDLTGLTRDDALGEGWLRALRPEDVQLTDAVWKQALASKRTLDVEYRIRTASASERWVRARAAPRIDDAGHVVRWYGTLEDIDDRRRTEQALRESEERFRLAAEAAGLGIWDLDAVNNRREWSAEFKAMLGLAPDVEPLVATALARVVPEDRHLLDGLIQAVQAGDSEHRFEVVLRIHRADNGAERWMQTSGWRIQAPNGHLKRVLVTVRDVTEQHNADERIRWTANHDTLTGLPNRGFFNEQLEHAIVRAQDEGSKLALILFDVDNLKETNDTIGHDAGDMLLLRFAERLRDSIGRDAFIARLGGDEFAAFLQVHSEADMIGFVHNSLQELRGDFTFDGLTLSCQATAGASTFPLDGQCAEDLLKTADIALYAGKANQRGMLSIFKPDMRAHVQRRASMLSVARSVIQDDRLRAHYQPKVSLADHRLIGFEALLRWRHDKFGMQGPSLLSAAFEDINLATSLGERMLDSVCSDIRRWMDQGLAFGHVGINLSPAEFRRDDLFERFMERLHRSDIPTTAIELEITESVFLGRGAEDVADILSAFHREGISIALDDFGTGYASLTHLQSFPVDVIKIDRSFVTELAPESANAAIVDAIIGLADRLNMKVIAEGIETRAEANYLMQRGCKYGQGFLFGKAAGYQAVTQLLESRSPVTPALD